MLSLVLSMPVNVQNLNILFTAHCSVSLNIWDLLDFKCDIERPVQNMKFASREEEN